MRHRLLTALAAALLAMPACADESATVSSGGPIRLADGPTRVTLSPSASLDVQRDRFALVLRGLTASAPPGVVYRIYLGQAEQPNYVGQMNFFGVSEQPQPDRFQSFDVTAQLRREFSGKSPSGPITVIIRPVGTPSPDAAPSIQRLELVRQ